MIAYGEFEKKLFDSIKDDASQAELHTLYDQQLLRRVYALAEDVSKRNLYRQIKRKGDWAKRQARKYAEMRRVVTQARDSVDAALSLVSRQFDVTVECDRFGKVNIVDEDPSCAQDEWTRRLAEAKQSISEILPLMGS